MKKNEDEKNQLFIESSYNLNFYIIRKLKIEICYIFRLKEKLYPYFAFVQTNAFERYEKI